MRRLLVSPWGLAAQLARDPPGLPLTSHLPYTLCKSLVCVYGHATLNELDPV